MLVDCKNANKSGIVLISVGFLAPLEHNVAVAEVKCKKKIKYIPHHEDRRYRCALKTES